MIQCAFGFEIELPHRIVYEAPSEELFLESPIPVEDCSFLEEGDVLARHDLMELQVDELLDGKSDLEFVSKPFDDSKMGFGELQRCLIDLRKILVLIGKYTPQMRLNILEENHLAKVIRKNTFLHYTSSTYQGLAPQITAGLRLSGFSAIMRDFGFGAEDEAPALGARRLYGRNVVGLNAMGGFEGKTYLMGKAVYVVENALNEYWRSTASPPQPVPSNELAGLLSLMIVYLYFASSIVMTYPKAFARILMRTDFSKLYELLPSSEQEYFKKNDRKEWGKLFELMFSARYALADQPFKAGHPDRCFRKFVNPVRNYSLEVPMFTNGIYNNRRDYPMYSTEMLKCLTRKEWIMAIPGGVDLLTERTFPDEKARSHLESLGRFGNQTDRLESGEEAPVFELRKVNTSGNVDELFQDLLSFFTYIYALNRGIDYKLGEPIEPILPLIGVFKPSDS
ncbi:MAG: hypothetical protein MI784_01605 [Cytophagales bacterium]|nr:hypothetical protein [Cytophagales bacterium]